MPSTSRAWAGSRILGVLPRYRQRGLGQALLRHTFGEFARRGSTRSAWASTPRTRRAPFACTSARACTSSGRTCCSRKFSDNRGAVAEPRIDVSIEHKNRPESSDGGPQAPEHVPVLRLALPRRRARGESRRLPAVRPPLPGRRARADRAARRRGHVRRGGSRASLRRPARLLRPASLPGAARGGRGLDRARRRDGDRPRGDRVGRPASSRSWTSRSWAARWAASSARSSRAPATARSSASVPLVSVTASGGARMQEGILSLMQLPKTVCAVEDLRDARLRASSASWRTRRPPACSRSFASLGDVIVAEPGALLAFTGPRVVQQTTREKLPDDFGLAESNLRFGHLDAIVPRPELRSFLARAARGSSAMAGEDERRLRERLSRLRGLPLLRGARLSGDLDAAPEAARRDRGASRPTRRSGARSSSRATRSGRTRSTTSSGSSTTSSSCTATAAAPTTPRSSPASAASAAGRSRSSASRRAATSRSAQQRNFGMPHPEGYRKAMRVMELARAPRLPARHAPRHAGRVPGRRRRAARPGRRDRPLAGADGAADVPLVACIIGEGGSGGAIAIGARRPRADAGERDLQRDLAGGLRRDPLARRRRGEEGGRGVQARRAALPRARRDRRRSSRSRRAAPT